LNKLLGNFPQGLIFVISAPAGTGKTTLAHMISEEFPCVVKSISCTTRSPREGEVEGKDYHFISKQEFEAKIQAGDFLEYANVFGNFYGTSKSYVTGEQKKGKHVMLVIDTQGALQLKGKIPATFIFISPPSLEVLKGRLIKRRSESPEMIAKRLSWAEQEMAKIGSYDYHIVNDNLDIAYAALRSILIAEEHKLFKENT
jgi:guanylate kinase